VFSVDGRFHNSALSASSLRDFITAICQVRALAHSGRCHYVAARSTARISTLARKPNFARYLRDARIRRGLSVAEVADQVGVSTSCIYFWETDHDGCRDLIIGQVASTSRVSAASCRDQSQAAPPPTWMLEPRLSRRSAFDRANDSRCCGTSHSSALWQQCKSPSSPAALIVASIRLRMTLWLFAVMPKVFLRRTSSRLSRAGRVLDWQNAAV
jgi:hypothetical protein